MMPHDPRRRPLSPKALEARKFAAIGQLAPGIAHEINTPMQYIGDNLRFLLHAFEQVGARLRVDTREGDVPVELAFFLEEIPSAIAQSLDGVAHVSQLVNVVKRFATARIAEVVMLDLNEAIESVLTIAHNEWKYVARVVRELDAALPLVPFAEAELKQVILSLVTGAARAIAPEAAATGVPGTITVTTRLDGDHAMLRVADSGVGATGAPGPRRALGFARDVVTEHHGTLHVVSEGGKEHSVVVRIPLRADTVLDVPVVRPEVGGDASRLAWVQRA
jgi:signal transduction histidine kinase